MLLLLLFAGPRERNPGTNPGRCKRFRKDDQQTEFTSQKGNIADSLVIMRQQTDYKEKKRELLLLLLLLLFAMFFFFLLKL